MSMSSGLSDFNVAEQSSAWRAQWYQTALHASGIDGLARAADKFEHTYSRCEHPDVTARDVSELATPTETV